MVTFSGGFLCGNCAIAAKSTSSLLKTHQNILKFVGAEAEELSSTFWLSSGRSVSLSNSTSYGGRAVNVTWGDKRQVQIPISCREDGGVSGETPSKCSSMPQGPKGSRSVKNLGGLQTATRFACKDAKLMGAAARNLDVRARNDLTILKE